MGLVTDITYNVELEMGKIREVCKEFEGDSVQPFHKYSSIMVRKGYDYQPLWWWSKNNRLDEIEIPTKHIHIDSIKILSQEIIDIKSQEIIPEFIKKVKMVSEDAGDFRQDKICKCWHELNDASTTYNWKMIELECRVSTGTYIRQLVNDISARLGTVGIAYDIYRTSIGSKQITDTDIVIENF
jgi:tRNA U55 pseudouridine synthase TruB